MRRRWLRVGPAVAVVGGLAVGLAVTAALLAAATSRPVHQRARRALAKVGVLELTALTSSERAAIEALRIRGASVTVYQWGDILVDFSLGAHEREWRKEGMPMFHCGMGVAHSFTPDDSGPPMTDADLAYLDRLPMVTRVNLARTSVTPAGLASLRRRYPTLDVEDRDR